MMYASDSFTLQVNAPNMWYYPGVAFQNKTFSPGSLVDVQIHSASFKLQPLNMQVNQGANVDLKLGLYDVSGPSAVFKQIIPYGPTYGSSGVGMLLNHTCGQNGSGLTTRNFDVPLEFQTTIPNTWSGVYQVGAAIHFFIGISALCQYEYHIHGETF